LPSGSSYLADSFFCPSHDLRRSQARSGCEVSTTGQFMLVRRTAYEAVGGHAAVHRAICEDLELAKRLKRAGYDVSLMGADTMLKTRMYTGWGTLWPGLAKNLVDTLGGPAATLGIALAAVICAWAAYLLPLIDLLAWRGGVDGALSAMLRACRVRRRHRSARRGGVLFWYPFLVRSRFPIGLHRRRRAGCRRVRCRLSDRIIWKGRTYS
jgi:chlorobactene glucosyltransferase